MKQACIQIEGMACQHCVASVTKALEACDGVTTVSVSLTEKQAKVSYDAEKTSLSQLKEIVTELGFEAE